MEKILNTYECMFAVSLKDGEDNAKTVVKKFTDLIAANGEIVKIDDWGKRRFAYPIQDMNDGYYTVVNFKSEGNFPAELERLMNIDEAVLRSMNIRLEYDPLTTPATPVKEEAPVVETAPETPVVEA